MRRLLVPGVAEKMINMPDVERVMITLGVGASNFSRLAFSYSERVHVSSLPLTSFRDPRSSACCFFCSFTLRLRLSLRNWELPRFSQVHASGRDKERRFNYVIIIKTLNSANSYSVEACMCTVHAFHASERGIFFRSEMILIYSKHIIMASIRSAQV